MYFQILHNILRDPMKRALENYAMQQMTSPGYKEQLPPFLQQIFDRGEEKGEERGKEKGRAEGEETGKLEGKREVLLLLVSRRGLSLSTADQDRIGACTEMASLERWIVNALDAKSADDLFR